jgi:hypothetical protein
MRRGSSSLLHKWCQFPALEDAVQAEDTGEGQHFVSVMYEKSGNRTPVSIRWIHGTGHDAL